jgi:peptide deformylase
MPIFCTPQPILNQTAGEVEAPSSNLTQLIQDMRQTMLNAAGVGLAAPQIGQLLRVCVLECTDGELGSFPFTALVNPRIVWKSPEKVRMSEACLSIPGVEGEVKRSRRVRIEAVTEQFQPFCLTLDGFMARVAQHEIDHLNGVLFTDYLRPSQLHSFPVRPYPTL